MIGGAKIAIFGLIHTICLKENIGMKDKQRLHRNDTRQVAKNLHKQFNNQNKILEMHTEILKDIASSQNQNHSEMIDVLKRIENKL